MLKKKKKRRRNLWLPMQLNVIDGAAVGEEGDEVCLCNVGGKIIDQYCQINRSHEECLTAS